MVILKRLLVFSVIFAFFINQFAVSAVSTSAKAAILINGDTLEVIHQENADKRLPMASTTKIMTGLILAEYGDFNKEITVTAEMIRVEGTSMGLLAGDKVTLHDLLYGLMLSSGNDAANVIAYVIGGTCDGFVKLMNQKAAELGLDNTHFETPSGLDGAEHYTTARDLAKLSAYAMKNQEFYKAVSSKSATLNYGNPPYRRTLTNHNKLLKMFDGAVGVKTGFTKKSGRCLVSAAKKDGKFVIAVTLSDPNDWQDHINLLNYGLNKVELYEITPEINRCNIPVIGAKKGELSVEIKSQTFSTVKKEDIICQINLPRFVYAPIKKGEKIGEAVYKNQNGVIKTVDIKSAENINVLKEKPTFINEFKENFKCILSNLWEK